MASADRLREDKAKHRKTVKARRAAIALRPWQAVCSLIGVASAIAAARAHDANPRVVESAAESAAIE